MQGAGSVIILNLIRLIEMIIVEVNLNQERLSLEFFSCDFRLMVGVCVLGLVWSVVDLKDVCFIHGD